MKTLIACALLSALAGSPLAAEPTRPAPGVAAPQRHVPGEPYRVGGEVTRPEKISGAPPVYSEEARKARLQGVVIVEAIIDENGDVINARVLKPLPMGLSENAVAAVSSWKFKPATLEGRPVKVYYTLTVNFQVDGDPKDPTVLLGLLARDRAAAPQAADAEVLRQLAQDLTEKRRTLDDAWQWAQSYYGDSRAAALVGVGGYAWGQTLDPTLEPQAKADLQELAGKALDLAIATQPEQPEAMALKALLLREKAQGATADLAEKTALLAESARLAQAAYAIYQKRHPAPAAP